MRAPLAWLAIAALPLLAAPAVSKDKADPFAGRKAGAPVSCVDTSVSMSGPTIAENGMVIINNGGRRAWLAKVRGQCATLRPFGTLIVDRWGSQLCRNDRFRVLEPGQSIPSNWCFFDEFVPYDRVK